MWFIQLSVCFKRERKESSLFYCSLNVNEQQQQRLINLRYTSHFNLGGFSTCSPQCFVSIFVLRRYLIKLIEAFNTKEKSGEFQTLSIESEMLCNFLSSHKRIVILKVIELNLLLH